MSGSDLHLHRTSEPVHGGRRRTSVSGVDRTCRLSDPVLSALSGSLFSVSVFTGGRCGDDGRGGVRGVRGEGDVPLQAAERRGAKPRRQIHPQIQRRGHRGGGGESGRDPAETRRYRHTLRVCVCV